MPKSGWREGARCPGSSKRRHEAELQPIRGERAHDDDYDPLLDLRPMEERGVNSESGTGTSGDDQSLTSEILSNDEGGDPIHVSGEKKVCLDGVSDSDVPLSQRAQAAHPKKIHRQKLHIKREKRKKCVSKQGTKGGGVSGEGTKIEVARNWGKYKQMRCVGIWNETFKTKGHKEVLDTSRVTCRVCGKQFVCKRSFGNISYGHWGGHVLGEHAALFRGCESKEDFEAAVESQKSAEKLLAKTAVGAMGYKARSKGFERRKRALARLCAWENLPFHLGERESFVHFMREWDPKWPVVGRMSVQRSVLQQAEEVKDELRNRILKVTETTDVNMTTDMWTALNGEKFITFTIHWIDEGWNFHTRILGTHELSQVHSAQNISNELLMARIEYGILPVGPHGRRPKAFRINPEDVRDLASIQDEWGDEDTFLKPACTTDMGANVSKAAELHGRFDWCRCMCHVLHVSVTAGLQSWNESIGKLGALAAHMHRSSTAWKRFREIQLHLAQGEETTESQVAGGSQVAVATQDAHASPLVTPTKASASAPTQIRACNEDDMPLAQLPEVRAHREENVPLANLVLPAISAWPQRPSEADDDDSPGSASEAKYYERSEFWMLPSEEKLQAREKEDLQDAAEEHYLYEAGKVRYQSSPQGGSTSPVQGAHGPLRLVRPQSTRWNSVFNCLGRALRLKPSIDKFIFEEATVGGGITEQVYEQLEAGEDPLGELMKGVPDNRNRLREVLRRSKYSIEMNEWLAFGQLYTVLKPLRDVSIRLEKDNDVTISDVALFIHRLLYERLSPESEALTASAEASRFVLAWRIKFLTLVDDVEQFFMWVVSAALDGRRKDLDSWLRKYYNSNRHSTDFPKVHNQWQTFQQLRDSVESNMVEQVQYWQSGQIGTGTGTAPCNEAPSGGTPP